MDIQKLPNAAASVITVTATATSLLDLIETASSLAHGLDSSRLNAIDLTVEDGNIRILMDGNTPTGANGLKLLSGNSYSWRGVPLTKMQLIRDTGESSDVAVSIQLGNVNID